MIKNNKNKILALSATASILGCTGTANAESVIPKPNLKPTPVLTETNTIDPVSFVPRPALKPKREKAANHKQFADISSLPTPSLKPSARSSNKPTYLAETSLPSPGLKPDRPKVNMTAALGDTSIPIPTRKPPTRRKHEKTLYAQVLSSDTAALAASATKSAGKIYDADFFSPYAPVTAADMVAQIPNFTLSEIDSKRGLGQGGVNVLINGARLSGKDNDARSALTRIPAASVAKIEIISGASSNIPGLSGTVANIITNQNERSGSWKYRAEVQNRSRANLFGFEGSISGSRGPFEYVIGFESSPDRDTEVGPETITDGSGQVFEMRDERALAFEDDPQISAELSYLPANGHVAHLNANYQVTNFRFEEASIQSAITNAGNNGQRLTSFGEDGWNGELGGDYAFDLGNGNLKLIGITRYSDVDMKDSFRAFDFLGNDDTSVFTQASQSGETIARGEYSWKQDEARDWQFAVEGAFNFLEIDATLAETDASGRLIDIPFPGSSSRVEEKRAESILTHNWTVSEKFNLQASAGVEFSELSQTGPSGLTREFVRPKGLLSTSYAVSDSFNIRTKIERTVGQLDFDTFISSIDPANNIIDDGNPGIVPAQSWDGEIELEKSWSNGVSGTLKIYGRKIEDVVDRIPLPDGGDAPGNIDNAEVLGVELVSTVLLDQFGMEGARLDLELAAENSSVTDAVTGLDRRLNDGLVSSYTINFRHDIPNTDWAWGSNIVGLRESANFRLNQISHATEGGPEVEAFVEHKDILGLTVRLDVQNALSSEFRNVRNLYGNGNRATGTFIGSESRVRTASPRYGISISGTF